MRGPRCDVCDAVVDPDVMHLLHDDDCIRFLSGFCYCGDLWSCAACCPDSACVTPLAAQLRAAHDEQAASIEGV